MLENFSATGRTLTPTKRKFMKTQTRGADPLKVCLSKSGIFNHLTRAFLAAVMPMWSMGFMAGSAAAQSSARPGAQADQTTLDAGVRNAGKIGVLIASHGDIDDYQSELEDYIKLSFQKNPGIPLPQWSRGILTGPAYALSVKTVRNQYQIIGPTRYRDSSEQQRQAIDRALGQKGVDGRTYVGFNFTPPLIDDAFDELIGDGIDTVVVFNKGAQFSYASSGENMEDALKYLNKKRNADLRVIGYRQYSDDVRFRDLMVRILDRDAKASFPNVPANRICLLIATHGLPLWLVDKGDPAIKQMEDAFAYIQKKLPQYRTYHGYLNDDFFPGAKWVKPTALELANQMEKDGCENILMDGRLSFTSHHRATLYDLNYMVRNFFETPPASSERARLGLWRNPKVVLAANFDGDQEYANLMATLAVEAVSGIGPVVKLQEKGARPLPVGSVGKPGVKPF
jgi:protoheme ferro-lyase